MPAILVKGLTFTTTVNAANLHALIGQATMSNLDHTNMDKTQWNVVREVENWTELEDLEPGVEEESFWLITRLADGSPASMHSHGITYTLDSGSDSVLSGESLRWLSVDSTNAITCTKTTAAFYSTNQKTRFWAGVSVTPTEPGGKGVMIMSGICKCDTEDMTPSVGDILYPSRTVDGRLLSTAADPGSGYYASKVGVVLSTDGVAVWANLFR